MPLASKYLVMVVVLPLLCQCRGREATQGLKGNAGIHKIGGKVNPQGKLEFIHNGAKFTFAPIVRKKIPSDCSPSKVGCFKMGTPSKKFVPSHRRTDEWQHEVTISNDYLMQTTEVTRGQFRAIMGKYPFLLTMPQKAM